MKSEFFILNIRHALAISLGATLRGLKASAAATQVRFYGCAQQEHQRKRGVSL